MPVQLAQMVDLLTPKDEGDPQKVLERVFQNAHEVLDAFVERLFTFSEQLGRGDHALRARVDALLKHFAAGLRTAKKSGSYVEYAELRSYLAADEPETDLDRILATAIDATILDMILGVKQVGFEAQQLEDYFAASALADPVAAVDAHLNSGQPTGTLQAVELADQAGYLNHAATS